MGLMETRCRICGAKVPRVRASAIAFVCLASGLTLGWACIFMLHI